MKYIYTLFLIFLFNNNGYCQLSISPLIGVEFVDVNQKGFEMEGSIFKNSDAFFPLKINSKSFRENHLIYGVKLELEFKNNYSFSSKFVTGSTINQKTTYAGPNFIFYDIYRIKFRTHKFNISMNKKFNKHFNFGLGVNYINYQNVSQILKDGKDTLWELKHDNKQIGLTTCLSYVFKNIEFSLAYGKGLWFLEKKYPRQFNPINTLSFTVGYKFVPEIDIK